MLDEVNDFRAVAPAIEAVPEVKLPPLEWSNAGESVRLGCYDGCNEPICTLTISIDGGDSEMGGDSMASLYMAMLREGSADYPADRLNELMSMHAARFGVSSSPHHHQMSLIALNSSLPKVLPAVADILRNPAMPLDAFERERASLAATARVKRERVKNLAQQQARKVAYGAQHPLSRTMLPEEIEALEHEQFVGMAKKYTKSPRTIFLSGHVTAEVRECVKHELGVMADIKVVSPIEIVPFCPVAEPVKVHIDKPGAKQGCVMLTLPAVARSHPDYVALHTAVFALGGFFGSRLMQNIRERHGLTYGIDARLVGIADGASIFIEAECGLEDMGRVETLIREELVRMASEPPAGEELRRVAMKAAANQLQTLDSPFTIANYYVTMQHTDMPADYFNRVSHTLATITPEEIARVSALYLNPDNASVVTCG